ncbi:class I adenylate-forming enzyme family protein [Sphingomonas sp. ac-8]|uniref:class I adenylate-forming enzyme family protein n=1 Tax=Sphingomonas sp. ac-8 TaxID=3242977 RepID=UPI003A810280
MVAAAGANGGGAGWQGVGGVARSPATRGAAMNGRAAMFPGLWRAGLFDPRRWLRLVAAVATSGPHLTTLLRIGGTAEGAVVDDLGRTSFDALARRCDALASLLRNRHDVAPGRPVGVLARNGVPLVRAVFAISRAGGDVFLLNPDMGTLQLRDLVEAHAIRLVLAEADTAPLLEGGAARVLDLASLSAQASAEERPIGRVAPGRIVVLTGGTTGAPKVAARAPSIANVARGFADLVGTLDLGGCRSVWIAVPLFHGFGLAALLIAVALGRTVRLTRAFDARRTAACLETEQVDALVVVPTMLQRLLCLADELPALRRIVCGGAQMPPRLAAETRARIGPVLFNLYGTSEAGVAAMATPDDLAACPDTIGRAIWGVSIDIRDEAGRSLADGVAGHLWVRSSLASAAGRWLDTGDLAMRDAAGRLFLRGRADDRIVSGGENVSPWEVERVLLAHPDVREAAVIGVEDAVYGQRLVAFVVPRADGAVDADGLSEWLAPRIARYQRPRELRLLAALPLTSIGKIDKRALLATMA